MSPNEYASEIAFRSWRRRWLFRQKAGKAVQHVLAVALITAFVVWLMWLATQ